MAAAEERKNSSELLLAIMDELDGGDAPPADTNVTLVLALATFVAATTTFTYGCNIGYTASTQSAIMDDLGLSVAEFSLFASMLTVGSIIGALVSGKVTDFCGRKCTLWLLNLFYIVGWLVIAFIKETWQLHLARLLLGFLNGISAFVASVYVAETTPKKLRGMLSALVSSLTITWGISFMDLVGPFVSWRILALIGLVPNLLQIPLVYFIPESPRWLVKIGKEQEMEAALMRLRGKKSDIYVEATEIRDYNESLKLLPKGKGLDLFQKKYAHHLLIGVGLFVLQNLDGMGAYSFYAGVIFTSAGISRTTGLVLLAVVQTLMGVLGAILIDKSGRRPLLLVSAAGLCLSTFVTGLSFRLQGFQWWKQVGPVMELISVLAYTGFNALGMGGISWLIVAEIFPMNVKGSAGSICNVVGSLCSLAVTYSFNFSIQWSLAGTFLIFSAICFGTVIFVAKLVPETKGRTLEEIQASITTHQLQ